jgi:nucleolar MIF4G domain-containing protein 1
VLGQEPLRVSLEDLRTADTKGKWWLVGSAWSGDPLVDRSKVQRDGKEKGSDEDPLLMLARKQGMNTDVRRSIFIVLMSSNVSASASEAILKSEACDAF